MTPQEVFTLRHSPDQALRLRAHGRAKVSACRRSDFQPLGSVGRAEDSTPAAGDPPQLDAKKWWNIYSHRKSRKMKKWLVRVEKYPRLLDD